MVDFTMFPIPLEADLDRKLERIIGLIMSGTATVEERMEYEALARQRSRLVENGGLPHSRHPVRRRA